MGKKSFFNFKNLFFVSFLAVAGIFSATAIVKNKQVEETPIVEKADAATVTKTRVVLELQDECYSTDSSRDPILHLWNITFDSTMEYDSTALTADMQDAGIVNDLESGGAGVRQVNDDGSIDTGMTWIKQEGSNRYWSVKLPWYIVSFTFKLHCGSYWGSTERSVTKRGSHMLYNYGSWDNWTTDITQDTSSIGNTYSVTNYRITAASSGGVSGDGHTAQVKGNGGSYTTYGDYFPRQKISLKATNGTYSSFVKWSAGSSTTSSTTYDFVGTAAKTYTATFADTRETFTVTFLKEDGTSWETVEDVLQGSSVTPSSGTPTKADEGGKYYTFDVWRDSSGNDKTSALANVQSDLTVYASYTSAYHEGRYVVGNFSSWGIEGAFYLPYNDSSSQFEGTATFAFGDSFKIAYYEDGSLSSYFGYSWILESCGAYHYFSGNGDSDIECYARGTYNFYFRDTPYAEGKKISIEYNGSLNAEHLAAKLMSIGEWEGHCGDEDRFPAMKTIYLGLSSTEKTTFQGYASSGTDQFKNAYDRYTAWARALGENPWAAGKASAISSFSPFNLMIDEGVDVSTVIIIIASSVSLLSITALSVLLVKKRKRKEE